MNFSKEFGNWYKKTFGDKVGRLNTIPFTQRGRQSDCLSGILDECNDAETEHKFLYLSLPSAISFTTKILITYFGTNTFLLLLICIFYH